jgi:hypothetical protein
MTIEKMFLDMMPSLVTIYPNSSMDAYGKLTHGATGVAVRCRIMETSQRYATERNRDEFENGSIIFYGTPTITTDSKILLPDGSTPVILSVKVHNDDTGAHHTTVTFGK